MNREELLKDKDDLQKMIRGAVQQIQGLQAQVLKWEGAIAYINDQLENESAE